MIWRAMLGTPSLVMVPLGNVCGNSWCSVAIATVFNNANQHINVYGDDIEVDYRGYEVKDHHYFKLGCKWCTYAGNCGELSQSVNW
jgi:glycosylphosphatidylinositol transamidase (GPIT) subunit GPI8